MTYRQIGGRETDEPLTIVHEALVSCKGLAADKLSALPPGQWIRWTHHFLKALAEGTTEVEYCDFLEELLADVGKQLEELQRCVLNPDLVG